MKSKAGKMTVIATAAVTLVSFIIFYFGTAGFWDMRVLDRLNQRVSATNKKIYIIGIDDRTLEEYGPVNTWSRHIPAQLVELLNRDEETRPAVIGFDVIYSEKGEEEGDSHFADACREAGNVVTALSFSFKEMPERDEKGKVVYNPYYVESVIAPYDGLRDSTTWGYANTAVDRDGFVRRAMAYLDYEGETVYSLSSQIYRVYQESRGEEALFPPVYGRGNLYYFSYSGKPGGYNVVSMADVLDGAVDPRLFKDAIVLVGAYAVGMQDSYAPSISQGSQMYGVEIHANIIDALLKGKTQLPVSPLLYGALSSVLCGIFFAVIRKGRILWVSVGTGILIVLDVMFARLMYGQGILTPVMLIPPALILIYGERVIEGYLAEILRRRKVVNVFKQYVAPQIVEKISKDTDFELVLGGENRHIAVLFVDIRGFTTMSESLRPEEVVEILNEYLSLTTRSIFDNGGTLDKFVGDATMAVFNAPFALDDYIFKAVCTAWDMKAGSDAIAAKFEKRFGKSVAFGIGVNCGEAVVGNIGCEFRMDYTAIGDTVNTAARLESNAKRGQILISQAVYEAVKDRVEVTPIGEIPLKGKSQGVFVYQVDEVRKG